MERKSLAEYFKQDKKLWEESFCYGKYWLILDKVTNPQGLEGLKLVRVKRSKNKPIIDWKDIIYMTNSDDLIFYRGDLLFMSYGDEEGKKQHFEVVGSLVKQGEEIRSEKEMKKKIKAYLKF